MLHYSLTISLGFPSLLALFIGGFVALTFIIRYRYLARYTQLKESSLPPISPQTLTGDLLPLTSGSLGEDRNRSSTFHDYLDDFLAAIRIFGYLEKPVFHELSRHLQTRRLAAGDTLEIGGGDFWCVVEGKVQVVSAKRHDTEEAADQVQFAPSTDGDISTPPSPGPSPTRGSYNGYHLLNEVSTGGTLSSLFSILTLFTEDIRLSWTPPPEPDTDDDDEAADADLTITSDPSDPDLLGIDRPRANSDVSQLGDGVLGRRVGSPDPMSPLPRIGGRSRSASSIDTATSTEKPSGSTSPPPATPSDKSTSLPGTKASTPFVRPIEQQDYATTGPSVSYPASPRAWPQPSATVDAKTTDSPSRGRKTRPRTPKHVGSASAALKGTIARATIDTTLAVIPVEAFKKLTRKFPKASGTVVQVVLERFSRVTFMTGKCRR